MFRPEVFVKGSPQLEVEIVGDEVEQLWDIAVVGQPGQLTFLHRDRVVWTSRFDGVVGRIEGGCVYDGEGRKVRVIPSFCQDHMEGLIIRTLELTIA